MGENIDSFGLIGDGETVALISEQGNLGWMCWPDFDSQACFASLIGTEENGVWSLAPKSYRNSSRRYLPGTLVLETTHLLRFGARVTVTDFMPRRNGHSRVVRIVRGIHGSVKMRTRLAPRFDYGIAHPRVDQSEPGCWNSVCGPHRLVLRSNVHLRKVMSDLHAEWLVKEGETYYFVLDYTSSYKTGGPFTLDALQAEKETVCYWNKWISRCTYRGPYKEHVDRSLLTLASLTSSESGGFVAAPTTSLPEKVGGVRNWDYRFCWLRDTTFALLSLTHCGYTEEAQAWLNWLGRSVQGYPKDLKIMYGITGKREHSEWAAEWLPGYKNSKPVHVGNKASDQLQLDTFGEVLDALYRARCLGMYPLQDRSGDALELPLLEHLEKVWEDPDSGLWETRGERCHFTQSKVMAWVAFDRGIRMITKFGMRGPLERWQNVRASIHTQICRRAFHKGLNTFTQAYGKKHLDASLLLMPLVGFLPIADPRITGTVAAVERYLLRDGLLLRYDTEKVNDGLPPGEGAFLACNFWLVDVYVLQGRRKKARELFEKLLGLANTLHLLSEEYDRKEGLIGNFPQAFSHIGLIDAALALETGVPVRLQGLD